MGSQKQQDVKQLHQDVASAEEKRNEHERVLQSELDTASSESTKLQGQVSELEKLAKQLRDQLSQYERDNKSLSNDIDALNKSIGESEAERTEMEQVVAGFRKGKFSRVSPGRA